LEKSRRILFFVLFAGLLLFLGLVFRQLLLANVLVPVATVVWLLLRIFVLSIGQEVYWWALIVLIVVLALFRLLRASGTIEPHQVTQSNATLERVRHWQDSILSNVHETGDDHTFKRDLSWLLTSLYTSRQQGFANFQIREALQQHEIPLPERVYCFLFADDPVAPRQNFFKHPVRASIQLLDSMRMAPRRWIRKWTGRDTAQYYDAIDELLTLMETSLEMKSDEDPTGIRNP
jgi:hypothetical protein